MCGSLLSGGTSPNGNQRTELNSAASNRSESRRLPRRTYQSETSV